MKVRAWNEIVSQTECRC